MIKALIALPLDNRPPSLVKVIKDKYFVLYMRGQNLFLKVYYPLLCFTTHCCCVFSKTPY